MPSRARSDRETTSSRTGWSRQTRRATTLEDGTPWGEVIGAAGVGIDGVAAVVAAAGTTGIHVGNVYDWSDTPWSERALLVERGPSGTAFVFDP